MCDSQVLNVITQLNNATAVKALPAPEPGPRELAFQAVARTLRDISIDGALAILQLYQCDRDVLYIESDTWNVRDLGKEIYFPELVGMKATETPKFWFHGGPPTERKYWKGTLQTLLEDRILCEIDDQGIEAVANWIGTPECTKQS